jgi:hypothetical protein
MRPMALLYPIFSEEAQTSCSFLGIVCTGGLYLLTMPCLAVARCWLL